ncbi:uncharacterized protein LOC128224272 [Mya arenaria]|uniref:uncharacterized protein LOC128224272 n=1 Tax=Mya arenaria TaxID=6604 RepID=UPI0022E25D92|nr:uncharacterized protein LOC128224272 [Mya arenaria]
MDPYMNGGLVLAVLAEVLAILSTALPYWYQISVVDEGVASAGLFEVCGTKPGIGSICVEYGGQTAFGRQGAEMPDWLKAAQAMMILSVIAHAGGIVLAGMYAIKVRDWLTLIAASSAATTAGVLFGLIGTAVAGAKFSALISPEIRALAVGSLHAAFGLGVLAVIIGSAAAIVLGVAWRRRVF